MQLKECPERLRSKFLEKSSACGKVDLKELYQLSVELMNIWQVVRPAYVVILKQVVLVLVLGRSVHRVLVHCSHTFFSLHYE